MIQLQIIFACYQQIELNIYQNRTVAKLGKPYSVQQIQADANLVALCLQPLKLLRIKFSKNMYTYVEFYVFASSFPSEITIFEQNLVLTPTQSFLTIQNFVLKSNLITFTSDSYFYSALISSKIQIESLKPVKSKSSMSSIIMLTLSIAVIIFLIVYSFTCTKHPPAADFYFDSFTPVNNLIEAERVYNSRSRCLELSIFKLLRKTDIYATSVFKEKTFSPFRTNLQKRITNIFNYYYPEKITLDNSNNITDVNIESEFRPERLKVRRTEKSRIQYKNKMGTELYLDSVSKTVRHKNGLNDFNCQKENKWKRKCEVKNVSGIIWNNKKKHKINKSEDHNYQTIEMRRAEMILAGGFDCWKLMI
ncbi:Hypothetical_protein [Hexamita inflata]|uniref:Hypothetical_protein n=1 Tax=Hexamita inflata TaxID=28002 RepID=A0AA86TQ57_9EUKA|nr:Hypothetical protein HINF_LOCUS6873 [Hexamita inflata]